MFKHAVVLTIISVFILTGSVSAFNLVNYGGRVEGVENGSYNISFAIYRTETEGTPLWEETHKEVQVTDGIFNVILGGISPISASVWSGDVWIETRIAGKLLSKRNPIIGGSEPRTTRLAWVEGTKPVTDGDWVISGDNMYSGVSGNVGIGTMNPTTLLHISKDATEAPSTHPDTKMIIEDGNSNTYLQIMAPAEKTSAVLFGETGAGGQCNDGQIGYDVSNGMRFWVDRKGADLIPLQLKTNGNVHITGGLTKAYTTGTRNLAIPVAYGVIKNDGTVFSATPNVSCTWDATEKHYEIAIADEHFFLERDVAIVTPMPISASFKAAIAQIEGGGSPGTLKVSLRRYTDGEKVQCAFHFVVYKGEQME